MDFEVPRDATNAAVVQVEDQQAAVILVNRSSRLQGTACAAASSLEVTYSV